MIKGENRKIHVCLLTHLQSLECDFMCMRASNCLWSQRKRDLNFRAHALLSRASSRAGLNVFIMNHDSNSSVKERRHFLFMSLFLKVRSTEWTYSHREATRKLDYCWHLLGWTRHPYPLPSLEVDLISDLSPWPFLVTWLAMLWPIVTSLVKGDPAVLERSGGATANNTLHTFNTWSCWVKLLNHFQCGQTPESETVNVEF